MDFAGSGAGIFPGAGFPSAAIVLLLTAVYILLSGLDDLAFDLLWLFRRQRRHAPPPPARERRIAVLVPLWQEAEVIERMLEHNLAAIRYTNYEFFVGFYPNDEATAAAVRRVAARHARVHPAEVPHDGPTSKADCLNWVYQRLLEWEMRSGLRAEIVVIHDAEDLIHPDSFARFNRWIGEAGMLQEPVLALPTPLGALTHGVYCDDFAESQMKDLGTRVWLGGFLPGCGVGTAFRREELDRLAETESNRIFDPLCLTEDYDNGLRLFRLGCRQMMLPLEGRGMEATATREYFPRSWRAAVRQRTRWITGNSLQAWQWHGWGRGMPRRAVQAWMFWRDRKGLWGSWIGLLCNLLFLGAAADWAICRAAGLGWRAGAVMRSVPGLELLLAANLALCAERIAVKMFCTARLYGWRFAAGAPLRMLWGNWINAAASAGAVFRFFRSRWTGQPLRWLKTEHYYPSLETLRAGPAFMAAAASWGGEGGGAIPVPEQEWRWPGWRRESRFSAHPPGAAPDAGDELPIWPAPRPRAMRALPAAVSDRLGILALGVRSGYLELAAPRSLAEAEVRELRRFTALPLRIRRLGPDQMERLLRLRDGRSSPAPFRSARDPLFGRFH